MAKHKFGKKKKTSKKKHSSKVKKLEAINAKSLSRAQKKHIKEFGELHPVNSSDLATSSRNIKKVQYVEDKESYSMQDNKISYLQSAEGNYSEEEEGNAYDQLMGSLGAKLPYPLLKQQKEEDDMMDDSDDDDDEEEDVNDLHEDDADDDEINIEADIQKTKHLLNDDDSNENPKTNDKRVEDNDSGMDDDDDAADDDDDYRQTNVEDDDESDSEDMDTFQNTQGQQDPFTVHFETDLDESVVLKLTDKESFKQSVSTVQSLGTVTTSLPTCNVPVADSLSNKEVLYKVKEKLCKTWKTLNGTDETFSPLQKDLFGFINKYQDVCYTNRNFDNGEEIRRLYSMHAVNHILKTRSRVLKNNTKIVVAQKEHKEVDDLRDQGLTRPKVLMLVPFRDSALKIVQAMIDLLTPDGQGHVMNKKRFLQDFRETNVTDSKRSFRPDDFEKMFTGNIDDCFRIGLAIKKNTIKLYSQFYSSDIIIASPLGLRTVIGTEGEKFGDFDFLSSIELLILDQVDVFLMQNWEHVQHIFDHLHKQPKSSHDVDFSRVRNWCLSGWSKFYRQTLLFSSSVSPELNSLFNKYCCNFAGKVKAQLSSLPGSICQVVTQVPQVFHRVLCVSFSEAADKRFEFFTTKILPDFRGQGGGQTAIFVPSYFDFVRLRNYFRREEISFAQISEYSKRSDMTRARNWFKEGTKTFLLYTERFYFFYRYRIRGIRNIILYGLPHYPHFYPEILNFLDTGHEATAVTCTAVYTKYDSHRLAAIVGSQRCGHMMSSKKHVHMFVTGE